MILDLDFKRGDKIINMYCKQIYDIVTKYMDKYEVKVNIKYKIVTKKI